MTLSNMKFISNFSDFPKYIPYFYFFSHSKVNQDSCMILVLMSHLFILIQKGPTTRFLFKYKTMMTLIFLKSLIQVSCRMFQSLDLIDFEYFGSD